MNQLLAQVHDIENQIEDLKLKRMEIKKQKYHEEKSVRMRSNNSRKTNTPQRVSINFKKEENLINKEREEKGLDELSYPKITELIIKHKKCWKIIKRDIIDYNTALDIEEEGGFND